MKHHPIHKPKELSKMASMNIESSTEESENKISSKKRTILATMINIVKAIASEEIIHARIGFDSFKGRTMYAKKGVGEWRPFTDQDYVEIRMQLENINITGLKKDLIRDGVHFVAQENIYDSAIDWINEIVPAWDGVKRIENFLHTYFGTEDSPYAKAISLYIWSALPGRVLSPGIKADMVPIFIGEQGCGKSTGVAAMCPDSDLFTEINLKTRDDDHARRMRGHLIAEISELRGINSRDEQSIKAFITRTEENWVPKYQEHDVSYKRRTFFIGTTNETTFLSDRTGNRRWLPIEVGKVDVNSIKKDCYQLWAEARDTYQIRGIQWETAQELAKERHHQYLIIEPWEEPVKDWIQRNGPSNINRITTNEALIDCLEFDAKHITKGEQMRMASIFKAIGLIQRRDSQSTFWTFKITDDEGDEPLPF